MIWLLLWAPSLVVLARLPDDRSRRLLVIALSLLIPIAGPLLSILAVRVRGGAIELEQAESGRGEQLLTPDDVRTLGELPPLLDRLLSPGRAERLAALVVVSTRADAEAIALLRWTIERGSDDAVLDAALTLEEIDLRREYELERTHRAVTSDATFERARAAADAAAAIVLTGLADGAVVPALAERSRHYYRLARSLDAERRSEIDCRLVRLELATARPNEALAIIEALDPTDRPSDREIRELRDDVCFAARRFDKLSYRPYAPIGIG
jgi:hypothetical protein